MPGVWRQRQRGAPARGLPCLRRDKMPHLGTLPHAGGCPRRICGTHHTLPEAGGACGSADRPSGRSRERRAPAVGPLGGPRVVCNEEEEGVLLSARRGGEARSHHVEAEAPKHPPGLQLEAGRPSLHDMVPISIVNIRYTYMYDNNQQLLPTP